MKIAFIAFTRNGAALAGRLCGVLTANGHACTASTMEKYADETGLTPLTAPLHDWTERAFSECDGIVFVSACGIAVRAIAPFIKNKTIDPAVVAVDECGNYTIPLLSGHIGGANALASEIANVIGATAIISTATDLNGKFAVDSWAAQNRLHICDMRLAKAISAALLNGEPIGFFSDFPIEGILPDGLEANGELGICVSLDGLKKPFARTLNLIPQIVTLGIGCRKSTDMDIIERTVLSVLDESSIDFAAVRSVASIDLKAHEQGLLSFCGKYQLSFSTFSAEQLAAVQGTFTGSAFVNRVTGVDNVCERAAVLAGGVLAIKKNSRNGVTVAAATTNWRVCFGLSEH